MDDEVDDIVAAVTVRSQAFIIITAGPSNVVAVAGEESNDEDEDAAAGGEYERGVRLRCR